MNTQPSVPYVCALVITLSVCPTWAADTHNHDPYERYNRVMFKFNEKADQYVLRPVAKAYQKVTPRPVRSAVGNFFNNLRDVVSLGSNILRGNVENAGYDFMRVSVNTTFGLGGLIDIASEAGMPNNKNTLGDTFASWGWKNSNYLVMPLTGPSTVRDGLGSAIMDFYSLEKALLANNTAARYSTSVLRGISKREALLPLTDSLEEVHGDKYAYTRDLFMSIRNKQVGNKTALDEENIDDLVTPENSIDSDLPDSPTTNPEVTPEEEKTVEVSPQSLTPSDLPFSSEASIEFADQSLTTEQLQPTLIQIWAKPNNIHLFEQ